MKKVIIMLVLLLTVSFVYADEVVNDNQSIDLTESILEVEADFSESSYDINYIETFDTCMRRTCYDYGNGFNWCTQWEEYDCDESELEIDGDEG